MKKVRMIVEMDEELYKAFAEQDVFISGMRTGKTLLSEIWKALKSATIVRMSEEKIKESCSLSLVYNEGFDKGYEKAKAEYKPKTGHWIKMPLIETAQTYSHECSLCGRRILTTDVGLSEFPYCHCGAKMVEPQESEDK
jgi:hypothetical protein